MGFSKKVQFIKDKLKCLKNKIVSIFKKRKQNTEDVISIQNSKCEKTIQPIKTGLFKKVTRFSKKSFSRSKTFLKNAFFGTKTYLKKIVSGTKMYLKKILSGAWTVFKSPFKAYSYLSIEVQVLILCMICHLIIALLI